MHFISELFTALIYQPLYNGLILLYDYIPDLGVGIIILTILIRILLLPVAKKSIESQKKMQLIQPEIKKLQQQYKDDKQKQGMEIMALYKKNNIHPASGCLPLIVQLVFLIALYQVFIAGINSNGDTSLLYPFIKNPGKLNTLAFGFLDLTKGNAMLAAIAAGLQYWQGKMMMPKEKTEPEKQEKPGEEPDFATMMQKQMIFMGPFLTFIIGFKFPAGLPLYWITTTIFMIAQQYYLMNKKENS